MKDNRKRAELVKARIAADKAWDVADKTCDAADKAWGVADKAWDVANTALRDYDRKHAKRRRNVTYLVINQKEEYFAGSEDNGDPKFSWSSLEAIKMDEMDARQVVERSVFLGETWVMVLA